MATPPAPKPARPARSSRSAKPKGPVLVPEVIAIRDAMEAAGLTMYALAKLADMKATVLQRLLSGERLSPRIETLRKLAEALGKRWELVDGAEAKGK